MGTRPSHRRRTFRTGLAATAAGILVAVTGLVAAPASAGQGQGQGQGTAERGSVTICHRTNSPSNPYTKNRVSYRPTDGAIVGNDHVSHGGPAFDYTADPADADYPYTTPRDGDQWGDIIPPYEWDGGSYPGSRAWQIGGAAILEADCTGGSDVDEVDLRVGDDLLPVRQSPRRTDPVPKHILRRWNLDIAVHEHYPSPVNDTSAADDTRIRAAGVDRAIHQWTTVRRTS